MNIQPLGNRVLVRRAKVQTSKGGIFLPDTAQEKPKEGEILAVGPGALNENGELEKPTVTPGNRVLFSSYAGTEVKLQDNEDEELLILREDEILGVLVS